MEAKGTFEVKISPAEGTAFETETGIGRMTIDKNWNGDLQGHSRGVMLTTATESTGAMAYVALEKFTGKLGGKSGSFDFSHNASMLKGNAAAGVLQIYVIPGSGTGELAGLSGELKIDRDASGAHSYLFDYSL